MENSKNKQNTLNLNNSPLSEGINSNLHHLMMDIKSNLDLVFTLNNRIIELLSEEESKINPESLNQMVVTRNSLIEKSVDLIKNSNKKVEDFLQAENKNTIEIILDDINKQELIIKNLFEKQLNILKSDIIKFTNTKNVSLYTKSN